MLIKIVYEFCMIKNTKLIQQSEEHGNRKAKKEEITMNIYVCPNCGELFTDDMDNCFCGVDIEVIIDTMGDDILV